MKTEFFAWIMTKIKKLINTKIVLFIVAVLFFLKSTALGEVLPKKPNYLRTPVGQSITYNRISGMYYTAPFTGSYKRIIDGKNRFSIPAPLRKQLSGSKVILQLVNKTLIQIFDYETWLKAVTTQAPSDPAQLAEYNRGIYTFAYPVEIDENKRVLIPEALLSQTDFKAGSRVIITGVGDRIEIKPRNSLSITPAIIRAGI